VDFDDTLLPAADGALDPIAPAVDPNIGLVLQERYRIVRKLGEGGMGRVYEAEHILIRRRVAIKCLHAQYAADPEVVVRFHREALAATSIGNEHIVEVTDMGRFPDGAVYMVLEFLEGRDLGDEIEQHGTLAVGRAVRITRQICEALAAAHSKGIIHRDLKPENIYLIRRGREPDFVKVLDFGVSKFRDGADGAKTGTGVMIGTPYTMAPEQVEGQKDIDHRLDVYAIGVILYMALVGGPPFRAETIPMLVLPGVYGAAAAAAPASPRRARGPGAGGPALPRERTYAGTLRRLRRALRGPRALREAMADPVVHASDLYGDALRAAPSICVGVAEPGFCAHALALVFGSAKCSGGDRGAGHATAHGRDLRRDALKRAEPSCHVGDSTRRAPPDFTRPRACSVPPLPHPRPRLPIR
jgi:hypothetical protein